MKRKPFWTVCVVGKLAATLCLSSVLAACSKTESPEPFPAPTRVVLITIDTLRADHLQCYGYPRPTSPFLREMAEQGVTFDRAYSTTSHTSPAHVSLFTSLHLAQHKVLHNTMHDIPDGLTTLAEMYRKAGYRTAAFPSVRFLELLNQGFDVFDAPEQSMEGDSVYYRQAADTVDRTLAWFDGVEPTDAFFVWMHLYDPHGPYQAPDEYEQIMTVKTQAQFTELMDFWVYEQKKVVEGMEAWSGNANLFASTMSKYDAEILYADRQIKRLVESLETQGLNENTLWIVTSDHGECLGSHAYSTHDKYIYEELVRVPLIFWMSGHDTNGRRVHSLASHVDIMPTLAEIAGAMLPPQLATRQGRSLWPIIQSETHTEPRSHVFAQRIIKTPKNKGTLDWEDGPIYSLRNDRYKYIYHTNGRDEFFDLESDPYELKNLIDAQTDPMVQMRKEANDGYNSLVTDAQTVEPPQMSAEFEEELKALGYL